MNEDSIKASGCAYEQGFRDGQAAQKRKDAEIARGEKCGANEHDHIEDRRHDRLCEDIAKAIEEQEEV